MNEKQIILITGTRKGIGRFLVEHYTSLGHQVIGCSRNETEYSIDNYQHFCLDVCDEKDVKRMFSQIRKSYGRLDILINNAGIASKNHALLTAIDTVHEILNTNVVGAILFCREGVKLMKKNNFGRIVNFSSVHIPFSTIGTSIYGASKASLEQFSKVLAREVFSFGITINVLAMSVVENSGMAKDITENIIVEILDKTISKSKLDHDDITHTIDFLIRRESKMITGQILNLGGF